MIRTIVAISNEKLRETIVGILNRSGIEIRQICTSGQEAIRVVKRIEGGVIITSTRLTDMTADELASTLRREAFFMVLGKPSDLGYLEDEDLFRIPLPVRSGELIGALNILLQLDARQAEARIPKRTDEDRLLITQAKELLMYQQAMTEDQAYRFIQRRSMETSTPMTEVAQLILTTMH
jgi:CheY-like chemotaxis protein